MLKTLKKFILGKSTPPNIGRRWHPKIQDYIGAVYPRAHTPGGVKSLLRSASSGFPKLQNDFIDEMLESGDPVSGIWAQRKNALTGDEWNIVPASEISRKKLDSKLSSDIAQTIQSQLEDIKDIDIFLSNISDAIGYSYSVGELVWKFENGQHVLSQLINVNRNSIIGDRKDPTKLRIIIDNNNNGELLDQPNKWVVNIPNPIGGSPFRGGVLRTCIVYHMIRRYGFQWLSSFTELFGTPYRLGKYPTNASVEEKDELLSMLKDFGNSAYGVFSEGTSLDLIESSKAGESLPHISLINMIDDWCKIRIIGQTLTTDVGISGTGSFALGKVHNEVREDIVQSDRKNEEQIVRQQIIKPMLNLSKFPNVEAPFFVRKIKEKKDIDLIGRTLNTAVNDLGMKVEKEFAHNILEIPMSEQDNNDIFLVGKN